MANNLRLRTHKRYPLILSLLLCLCVSTAYSAEADHFTSRSLFYFKPKSKENTLTTSVVTFSTSINLDLNFYKYSKDSLVGMNDLANSALNDALKYQKQVQTQINEASDFSSQCDRYALAESIRTNYMAKISNEKVLRSYPLYFWHINIDDSIYADFSESDGLLYGSKWRNELLGPLIRIGTQVVGFDKPEHFFEFGEYLYHITGEKNDLSAPPVYKWPPTIAKSTVMFSPSNLFRILELKSWRLRTQGNLNDALQFSFSSEQGVWGKTNNGIISYGDLMANYKGLLFYQDLFNEKNPYYICENNEWVRTSRKFNWLEHIDAGWDESINCNEYGSEATADKVKKKISQLQVKECPVVEEDCTQLGHKYFEVQNFVLHPMCRTAN